MKGFAEFAEISEPFDTIIKKYPNGDIAIKKLNFTAMKVKKGYVEHETFEERLERVSYERRSTKVKDTYASIVQKWRDDKKMREHQLFSTDKEDTLSEIPTFASSPVVKLDGGKGSDEKRKQKILYNIAKTRNKIFDIARSNDFNYFITLTYDFKKCDRYSFTDCSKKVRRFMNNFATLHKKDCPNFKYLLVHEKHKDGAFHYHGLIFLENPDLLKFDAVRTRQYNAKHKNKLDIYNWSNWRNGFSTVSEIRDQMACRSYILKYINKDIDEDYQKGQRHFYYSQNCAKPITESCMSPKQLLMLCNEVYKTDRSTGYEITQEELDEMLKTIADHQYGVDL